MDNYKTLNSNSSGGQSNKIILILLALIVIFGAVLFFLNNRSPQQNLSDTTPAAAVNNSEVANQMQRNQAKADLKGKMSLKANSGVIVPEGEEFVVTVSADSMGDQVTAYDAVIVYDRESFAYISSNNLLDKFEINAVDKEAGLMLTGYKSLAEEEPVVFDNTNLAEVTFMAKKAGTSPLKLMFARGKTADSNLVNEKTQDILGSVEDITIQIGN